MPDICCAGVPGVPGVPASTPVGHLHPRTPCGHTGLLTEVVRTEKKEGKQHKLYRKQSGTNIFRH